MSGQIHFEVFVRRQVNAPWTLQLATEDRAKAVAAGEELMASGKVAAVRVIKEVLDPETREFKPVTLFTKGQAELTKKSKDAVEDDTPVCVSPQDLYTLHAREKIARLMETWLVRKRITCFEMMHRPDLIEQLEASGIEIQGAIQKVAIPESQARGTTVHEVIRTFQGLIERAVERVLKDGRKGAFPDVSGAGFAAACTELAEDPERSYLIGGGVAQHIGAATTWSDKVGMILDLAERAPEAGRPRAVAFQVLEQPLSEILGSRVGLADLLGADLDHGGSLAALCRLVAPKEVEALIKFDAGLLRDLPPLASQAARLAGWLAREAFDATRVAVAKRILLELGGPRRLRPADAAAEIDILRALAMALTAAASDEGLLRHEDVHDAFVERSKALVAANFVEAFLAGRDNALAEAEALVKLTDNVAGGANKRAACRWIEASIGALRFEKELRGSTESPAAKLATLAELQRAVSAAGVGDADSLACREKIGEIAGLIEADSKLTASLARASAPVTQRLQLLLRLACGEAAPAGPVADRAKAEALRLLKAPETRAELASSAPEQVERLKTMMVSSGLMSGGGLAA